MKVLPKNRFCLSVAGLFLSVPGLFCATDWQEGFAKKMFSVFLSLVCFARPILLEAR
jgi:hypothetical protein